jgi:hypothetical protein
MHKSLAIRAGLIEGAERESRSQLAQVSNLRPISPSNRAAAVSKVIRD